MIVECVRVFARLSNMFFLDLYIIIIKRVNNEILDLCQVYKLFFECVSAIRKTFLDKNVKLKFFRLPVVIPHIAPPPGQNQRNGLFFQLFLSSAFVWPDIYVTDTSSINQLIPKVSAL